MAAKGARVSYLALARAVLSGPVPPDVWRDRMRVCLRCPVYDAELKRCHKLIGTGSIGCGCYSAFKALTAAPYSKTGGCWVREIMPTEGWPAYVFPSRWAKVRAVWRFIFSR